MKFFTVAVFICLSALASFAQEPTIVQPGAPGQPTKVLPANTTAKLPPISPKDVEFMQGMIMHHGQAVEMTAMIADRTKNSAIRKLGAKISLSQAQEMDFMRRWLKIRGEKIEMSMEMSGMDHSHSMMMPGMLTDEQMEELRMSTGAKFDRLFLQGMIQHHGGALTMVTDLFAARGAGQDAELFNFASDVDTGQRGEIKIMQNLLQKKPKKEK